MLSLWDQEKLVTFNERTIKGQTALEILEKLITLTK